MERDKIRNKRDAAISSKLRIDETDRIFEVFSRDGGLFIVSLDRITRIRLPDDIDPEMHHEDAPMEEGIILPIGSKDDIVARTIMQTRKLIEPIFASSQPEYKKIMDNAWGILFSAVSLRSIRNRLAVEIDKNRSTIESDWDKYTTGQSPHPVPVVEYFDIEFRSFAGEAKRALIILSEIFKILTAFPGKAGGNFEAIREWVRTSDDYGEQSILFKMLDENCMWTKLWVDMRNAIDHPNSDSYLETSNFTIEANRSIRLPTWRLVHPNHKEMGYQRTIDSIDMFIDNVIGIYECFMVELLSRRLPEIANWAIRLIDLEKRDADCPMAVEFVCLGVRTSV